MTVLQFLEDDNMISVSIAHRHSFLLLILFSSEVSKSCVASDLYAYMHFLPILLMVVHSSASSNVEYSDSLISSEIVALLIVISLIIRSILNIWFFIA